MEMFMKRSSVRKRLTLAFVLVVAVAGSSAAQAPYYPSSSSWEKRTAEQVGLSQSSVDSAVKLAIAAESTTPRNLLENHVASSFGREPHSEAVRSEERRVGNGTRQ